MRNEKGNTMKHLLRAIGIFLILLFFVGGCTIIRHEYGANSVLVMVGDQAYKVDATNDGTFEIKDLIPSSVFGITGQQTILPESKKPVIKTRLWPSVEVNYNTPKEGVD